MPYEQYLKRLPAYLQQLTMESNGKHVTLDGTTVDYDTGRSIGASRHERPAQLLPNDPSGTTVIPVDLIGFAKSLNPLGEHHDILSSNVFAQAKRSPSARLPTRSAPKARPNTSWPSRHGRQPANQCALGRDPHATNPRVTDCPL